MSAADSPVAVSVVIPALDEVDDIGGCIDSIGQQDLPLGGSNSAFGFYGLGEYQFAQRWYVGGRIDRSGRALDGTAIDKGGSVFMTFWPSEFAQIRGQLRRTNYAEGIVANDDVRGVLDLEGLILDADAVARSGLPCDRQEWLFDCERLLQLDRARKVKYNRPWSLRTAQPFTQRSWSIIGKRGHVVDVATTATPRKSTESLRARKG